MSLVLVTGGSGYLGTQLTAALLRDGRQVRATVRSRESESDVRAAVGRGGADDSGLEVAAAELTADAGWAGAADHQLPSDGPHPARPARPAGRTGTDRGSAGS